MPVRDSDLGHQLIRIVKLAQIARTRGRPDEAGIEPTTYGLLFALEGGPQRLSDLAVCVHTEISTTSRQVSALARHGLVDKVPDPDDGRAQLIEVTPQGRATMERLRDMRDAWLSSMLADWKPEDIHRLAELLHELGDAVETSLAELDGSDG